MKSKAHFLISLIKSVIRIAGCILALITNQTIYLAIFFLSAELLGIAEEIFDKRD